MEHEQVASIDWSEWRIILLLAAFTITLFAYYIVTPSVMKITSATALNLSLLTADFYTLIVGVLLFQFKVRVLLLGFVQNKNFHYIILFTLNAVPRLVHTIFCSGGGRRGDLLFPTCSYLFPDVRIEVRTNKFFCCRTPKVVGMLTYQIFCMACNISVWFRCLFCYLDDSSIDGMKPAGFSYCLYLLLKLQSKCRLWYLVVLRSFCFVFLSFFLNHISINFVDPICQGPLRRQPRPRTWAVLTTPATTFSFICKTWRALRHHRHRLPVPACPLKLL